MPPPNWSDPLPVHTIKGDPPRVSLPESDSLNGKGKKRDAIPICFPKVTTYGLPRYEPEIFPPKVVCPRGDFARLGKKTFR